MDEMKGIEARVVEDTVPELNAPTGHHRAPSISQQSRMRSSSFRSSGGFPGGSPLPSPGFFPTDGDTAPEIHRKQALKIEELEKENRRLAKEASDGEKRWKKAEEELEDLRDGDTDSPARDHTSGGTGEELEKLVSVWHFITSSHFALLRKLRRYVNTC